MTCIQLMDHFVYCFLQRLNEARRMMDKLRACIVANYFASAGMTKATEVNPDRTWIVTVLFKVRSDNSHSLRVSALVQE